ncbi:trypsin-like serine protease [Streptomyces sp. NPDC051546]|uniref:trypsin-like serine protease n=1 Tax=Streptomyces sp. NPDC051546 TaxID=3365655 RepID=UPI0037AB19E2
MAAPAAAAGFGRTKTDWVQGKVHTAAYGVTSVDATAIAGKGAVSICQGDAGGPLVDGQGELVGISTHSWQGGCLGTPDTETRTDAIAARAGDLRGWTTEHVTPVPGDMTGDGLPDMVAIDTDGKLRLYPGNGIGGLGTMVEIGTGGWVRAQITHRGDWTDDGMEEQAEPSRSCSSRSPHPGHLFRRPVRGGEVLDHGRRQRPSFGGRGKGRHMAARQVSFGDPVKSRMLQYVNTMAECVKAARARTPQQEEEAMLAREVEELRMFEAGAAREPKFAQILADYEAEAARSPEFAARLVLLRSLGAAASAKGEKK